MTYRYCTCAVRGVLATNTYIYICICYQPPSFEMYLRETQGLRRRTEITPVKDSHTRIQRLALTNGHGRCKAATPE